MNLGQIGNSMSIMNTLNNGFNKITETRQEIEKMNIFQKIQVYFKVTQASVNQRLCLMVTPFYKFSQRYEGVEPDLYVPMVSYEFYLLVSAAKSSFQSTELDIRALKFVLGFSLILIISHITASYLVAKPTLHAQTTILNQIADCGYAFFYTSIAIMFKPVKTMYWVVLILMMGIGGLHRLFSTQEQVKQHQSKDLTSTSQQNIQNVTCIILSIIQVAFIFGYALVA